MLVPMVIETSSRGERAYDIYSRLLQGPDHLPGRRDRRPHGQPDHRPAAVPGGRGPERDIRLYINSPGGVVTAGLAIYDTMQYLRAPVSHDLHRHGRVDGRGPAGGRREGQALRAAELAGS